MTSLNDVRRIQLPKIHDVRGNLTFAESERHVPFAIRRSYWIYDVPGGEYRPGHAYRELHEFIIALSGSFDLVVSDGDRSERFQLNRSYNGIYVPPMIWRKLDNFSTNSFCLVLASDAYDESGYLRNFEEFRAIRGGADADRR